MKVACLQLNPVIGEIDSNIRQADDILERDLTSAQLDLLVLPELAFTGYNFPSLESIEPFLEPTTSGRSTQWAIAIASRLKCHVTVGYPEVSSERDGEGRSINYNSTVTVGPDGNVLMNYRKSFLYYTDESWAAEGSGFFCGPLGNLGIVGHGICMDINPYQFTAPYTKYEFATHVLEAGAKLIVLSTAWLTHTAAEILRLQADSPDLDTLMYWLTRFSPFIQSAAMDEEVFVLFCNRVGTEENKIRTIHAKNGQVVELGEFVSYAGSSCVLKFSGSQASIVDVLGQGEEGLMIVDTSQAPKYEVRSTTSQQSGDGVS